MMDEYPVPTRKGWCMWRVYDEQAGRYFDCDKRARWYGRGARTTCGEHKAMLVEKVL